MTCTKSKKRAFTLVELLVVIAVLGVLLAILLPALGRARGQATLIACQATLRQVGAAMLVYAQDNSGRLAVDRAMLGPSFQDGYTNATVLNSHRPFMDQVQSYINDEKLWYCPDWHDTRFVYSTQNVQAGELGYFYFSVAQGPMVTQGAFVKKNTSLSKFMWDARHRNAIQYPRKLTDTMHPLTWVASDLWFSGKNRERLSRVHKWYGKGVNYITLEGALRIVKADIRADDADRLAEERLSELFR